MGHLFFPFRTDHFEIILHKMENGLFCYFCIYLRSREIIKRQNDPFEEIYKWPFSTSVSISGRDPSRAVKPDTSTLSLLWYPYNRYLFDLMGFFMKQKYFDYKMFLRVDLNSKLFLTLIH